MENKFTPGPWEIDNRKVEHGCCWDCAIVSDEKTFLIAECSMANARLIAASPTLYDYAKRKAESGCNEAQEMLALLGIS